MDIRKPHYKDECLGFFHRGRKLWSGMAWALAGMAVLLTLYACARMGSPDGGWYDETPPRVIGATPEDKATGVKGRKIHIRFNEFIKVDNATENVVVSPPQLEAPEIKAGGKNITVELKDSLKPNTTYTIDFSNAISDNNEGNPLGGYTYTFATGQKIDTLEVSGYVLEAENLEPVKGILVGLYAHLADSAFERLPMLRVSKTDSRGHFTIKGVAPGKYRVYALQDVDGDYRFTQKSEQMAFSRDTIVPSSRPDVRQDTLWRDSLRIDSIARVGYTRFLPDDVMLRAFTAPQTDRFLIKAERSQPECFSLFFTTGNKELPRLRGLNFKAEEAVVVESTVRRDTLIYWLRDTALVNNDTLRIELQYLSTDTTGQLREQTDTLEMVAKQSYVKRMKDRQKLYDEWKKTQDKARKKGDPYETEMRPEALKVEIKPTGELDPDSRVALTLPTPLALVDTSKIHLYAKHDTLWYEARHGLRVRLSADSLAPPETPLLHCRRLELTADWQPGIEYSLELDSMAFVDLYGGMSGKMKQGFRVKSDDDYSTLSVGLSGLSDTTLVVQLLNSSDGVVKQVSTTGSTARFSYVRPGTYYLRLFVDTNRNGLWDTGNFAQGLAPESVYYYPEEIECKAKWDVTRTWNPTARPLNEQKPQKITKQKPDKAKTVRRRNAERARELGIAPPTIR